MGNAAVTLTSNLSPSLDSHTRPFTASPWPLPYLDPRDAPDTPLGCFIGHRLDARQADHGAHGVAVRPSCCYTGPEPLVAMKTSINVAWKVSATMYD